MSLIAVAAPDIFTDLPGIDVVNGRSVAVDGRSVAVDGRSVVVAGGTVVVGGGSEAKTQYITNNL